MFYIGHINIITILIAYWIAIHIYIEWHHTALSRKSRSSDFCVLQCPWQINKIPELSVTKSAKVRAVENPNYQYSSGPCEMVLQDRLNDVNTHPVSMNHTIENIFQSLTQGTDLPVLCIATRGNIEIDRIPLAMLGGIVPFYLTESYVSYYFSIEYSKGK